MTSCRQAPAEGSVGELFCVCVEKVEISIWNAKYNYLRERLQIDVKDISKHFENFHFSLSEHSTRPESRSYFNLITFIRWPWVNFCQPGISHVCLNDERSQWLNQVAAEVLTSMSVTFFPVQLPVLCKWSTLCCPEVLSAPKTNLPHSHSLLSEILQICKCVYCQGVCVYVCVWCVSSALISADESAIHLPLSPPVILFVTIRRPKC